LLELNVSYNVDMENVSHKASFHQSQHQNVHIEVRRSSLHEPYEHNDCQLLDSLHRYNGYYHRRFHYNHLQLDDYYGRESRQQIIVYTYFVKKLILPVIKNIHAKKFVPFSNLPFLLRDNN